ncbi:hypothetical protein EIB96_03605 [Vibrio parahaemolyticus]|uniref:hypothetical protein n=1 Tax=Vibrio parahaemolyticus TaxID=670 RepID=UPI00038E5164|nr:hypothetical protein [Vibrio parahaemolyticus]EGR0921730.1 hypothetical protein [Vibrio parahaemolyticus]EGR0985826.1 hypothetical protein [Vibrio parahaemolyticus]EGR1949836.1 hypothetical protein [Vibrio parahaemolyticus]EGR2185634.1 hypothetical protein [Vibrio parahaemolyticus]EHR6471617.1 hypothetical protein [Vibrio parahaemolyticus]
MKKVLLSIAIAGSLLSTGCAQRVADFTLASTKNVDLNGGEFVKGPRVTGEDAKPIIIVPLGVPSVKEAADKAIENDACAVGLTDVTADSEFFSFLVGFISYKVEGDLVIDKSKSGCENWSS